MTPYTEQQIYIRAMPCPKCNALPTYFCNRKPNKDGIIRSHAERKHFWRAHCKIYKLQLKQNL